LWRYLEYIGNMTNEIPNFRTRTVEDPDDGNHIIIVEKVITSFDDEILWDEYGRTVIESADSLTEDVLDGIAEAMLRLARGQERNIAENGRPA